MNTITRVLLLCGILFSLAGCQAAWLTEWASASGGVLFQDGFGDVTSGWAHLSGEYGAADYFENGYRIWVSLPNYNLWSTPGLVYSDIRMEVDAARIDGPLENRYGLICRYQDAQNYYFFVISSDGYFGIGRMLGGETSMLGQEMMAYTSAIHTGIAPNHLRAECVGDGLTFYINDQPVAVAHDTSFSSGEVGLLVGTFNEAGVDILFDEFVIYKP